MRVQVKVGNPVILTEADIEKYQRVVNAADSTGVLEEVTLNVENLTIVCSGIRKTFKYPQGADVSWVVQTITKFSETANKEILRADKSSQRFVDLCAEILSHGGGNVTIEHVNKPARYGAGTVDVKIFHLFLDKGVYGVFNASCEASALAYGYAERIKKMIEAENAKRSKAAETERLRRLAREKGLI